MTAQADLALDMSPPRNVTLSASAARRINQLNAKDGTRKMFRVTVSGGGCSGFQYGFQLDDELHDDDVTFDYIFNTLVVRGSPNRVVDRILALHEKIGDFGTLLYCGKDWADPALGRRSMELMAEKVMPAVNAALTKSVAAE